jgi:hypothetical protein
MLGIEDRWVGLAYVLCIASMALCVIYAWANWNRGDETIEEEDQRWEAEEKEAEENI